MTSEADKEVRERIAFHRFAERSGDRENWLSVESCKPPRPDLLCKHAIRGCVAFELVRICDPNLAKVHAAGVNATEETFTTSDPSKRIVADKLRKSYVTEYETELLIYTDGLLISTDDMIIPTISPLFDTISHPFVRVWFMGENVIVCLWQAR